MLRKNIKKTSEEKHRFYEQGKINLGQRERYRNGIYEVNVVIEKRCRGVRIIRLSV